MVDGKVKYLGKNILLFLISSFGIKFLSFALVPLYTSVLSTEEYGTADMISTTATFMMYVFTLNIADAVLRYGLDKEKDSAQVFSVGCRVFCMGSVVLAAVLFIAEKINVINWNSYYYFFIWLYYFCSSFYQLMTNYLRAIDKVTETAFAGVLSTAVMMAFNIVFLLIIKIGVCGYLISLSIGPLAGGIYCTVRLKILNKLYFVKIREKKLKKEMLSYSIPLIFNNIALWINAFLDKYFVTGLLGVGENGIYSVSYKIPTVLSNCFSAFTMAWHLSAIKEFDPNDTDGFFSKTYRMYNSLICFICSILIFLNIPLAKFLFAKDFFEAWKYSSILLIAVMFNALTAYFGGLFGAVKKTKANAMTTVFSAIMNAIMNMIMIPRFAIQGAAIATAVSYGLMWLVRLVVLKRYIKLKIDLFRDLAVYILLIVQVVFEHLEGSLYLCQLLCMLLVFMLYKNNVIKIAKAMLDKFARKRHV